MASIQSLRKLLPEQLELLERLGRLTSCIVIDEAHHSVAPSHTDVLRAMATSPPPARPPMRPRTILKQYCLIAKLLYRHTRRKHIMGRWAEDATEFVVSVTFVKGAGSSYGCIPKPVLAKLGHPKALRYVIDGDRITVKGVMRS